MIKKQGELIVDKFDPNNIILATDSYKITHWDQYPPGTETVYSYFESREGAAFPYTVFFGLQSIIRRYLTEVVVDWHDIKEADELCKAHFGRDLFNKEGWEHIVLHHSGRLPILIKAVPEGTPVPTGNVLMTVENTDPKCWWLTNAVESLLTHVWYPSTVATLSRHTKEIIAQFLDTTGESRDGLPFMLHDFGYRGASSHESAAIGGAAHLINFQGTDTLPAMLLAVNDYDADLDTLAFSVPATEHSVMTSLGPDGEYEQVQRVLDLNPTGIVSIVADSYDYYGFVKYVGQVIKDQVLARDGVLVIRPDSKTREHPTPASLVEWTCQQLWLDIGGTVNSKGFKVLDPHVRVLWGDGLDPRKIEQTLGRLQATGFSAENIAAFGMGGGLLQKGIDRDTQRFAFKCSAQRRNGEWHDIYKDPLDTSKKSKRGRLDLFRGDSGQYKTVREPGPNDEVVNGELLLQTVLHNGLGWNKQTFDDVRANAELHNNKVEALAAV